MIKRSNELIYVKRRYLFPFKPMLDWEYKKLGYKKCDVGKTPDSKFFKTVYYVRHKEMPQPFLYSILYGLNFLVSFYRCVIWPCILIAYLVVLVINMFLELYDFAPFIFIQQSLIYSVFVIPINLILTSLGHTIYVKEEVLGKTDRALTNHGWDAWSSYKDNDSRFNPPISRPNSSNKNESSVNNNQNFQGNNSNAQNGTVQKNVSVGNVAKQNNFGSSYDQNNDDDVVTLLSANGEEIDFTEIAGIAHRGKFYAILQPVELLDGMQDDEALVFEVVRGEDGEDKFEICLDDQIIDAVFAEYDRLYEEANS